MKWPGDGTLIATCGGGAEEALEDELSSLGLEVLSRSNGTVRVRGGAAELVRTNIRSRLASRVLLPLVEGTVRDYEELYRLARRLPWQRIVPASLTIAVSAVSRDRSLSDSRLVALKIKDAVVDSQRSGGGSGGVRSSVDRRHPDLPISLFVADGHAIVSLDSSGAPLHERGYRREAGEAPLRETVAAAMLRYAEWDKQVPLVDPFCGSGTIVIEAAMMAANFYPGSVRDRYAFDRWPWIDRSLVARERSEVDQAKASRRERTPGDAGPTIVGRDLDPGILEVARRNAERAGVANLVVFETADAMLCPPPAGRGLVVTNPPYGERLEVGEARAFYGRFGDRLKASYAGWNAYVLSANRDGMKGLGLRPSSRRQVWNGGLDARLYEVKLFPPADE